MKILHFYNGRCHSENLHGVPKTVYNLARHQSRIGHQVSLFNLSNKPEIAIGEAVTVRNFRPNFRGWIISKELKTAVLELSPDIVHFHSMYIPANVMLARILRHAKIPYVVTPNGNCSAELLNRRPYLKIPYKLLLERPYLNKAHAVHSVGDTDAIVHYGVIAPIFLAPNGIDTDAIPDESCHNPIISARPEWAGRRIFTFIGRLDTQQKGLDLLLEGLSFAISKGARIGLVLVGPDWNRCKERLEKNSSRLSLGDSIHFAGPVYGDEKFNYLLSSDYFVHTSRWEGLSFSVIEALACGKPCLVTKPANPCGFIGPYQAGIEVDLSPASIGQGMTQLANQDSHTRKAMESAAKLMVQNEFMWPAIAQTVTSAYHSKQMSSL